MQRWTSIPGLLLVACSGGGGASPPVGAADLQATPAVAYPGARVALRPTFGGGVGRIDGGVGVVDSGGSYEVGPLAADTTFTLTVDRSGTVVTRSLVVPLRYREQVTASSPSPIARTRAGNALLSDGRVLQVGGASPSAVFWANSEVFTPGGNGLAPVGDLSTGRSESTVVPLPDGGALTFGGIISASNFLLSTLVEQWDPAAQAWAARGNLASTRFRHTATRLPDGRVLIAGGLAAGGPVSERDAEIWVPGIGPRSPANEMLFRRAAHTATTLANGRVLLAGGYDLGSGEAIARCEWFDPATETFTAGPLLGTGRFYHAAVVLADGRVLVLGGERDGLEILASAEVFDPATGVFTAAGAMPTARTEVRAVRLLGGDVLAVGGATDLLATDRIEVWSPTTGTWREWRTRLPEGRTGHALHALADGRVLLLGGDPGTGWPKADCLVID